jgi:hypothetical protein
MFFGPTAYALSFGPCFVTTGSYTVESAADSEFSERPVMYAKRLSVLVLLAASVVLIVGVLQAGAAGPVKVLKFDDSVATVTSIGFSQDSNTPPPIGARQVIRVVLENDGSQFGKPSGTKIGRALLDCTILAINYAAQSLDGNCDGIAHVPDGFFTFEGNGPLNGGKVNHYAITGGIGPYANDRGELKVVNNGNGTSTATITLYS